jgi:GGDEF domain-containing protein
MNRRLLEAYYIISLVFLLLLLGFAAWRIRAELERNTAAAQRTLSELQVKALSTYLAEGSFTSEYFKYDLKRQFAQTPRLLVLVIYSSEQGIQYLLARDRGLLAGAPDDLASWRGGPEYVLRAVFERSFTVPFTQQYFLDVVFRLLDWPDLYPVLRELFYMLLAYLVVAAVMLLAAGASAGSRGAARAVPAAGGTLAPFPPEEPDGGTGTQALVSPQTGLVWKAHLSQRLGHELERAAASDQDLALLLAALDPAVTRSALSYDLRQLAAQALSSFPFKDLAFEYDERTCAIILPDMDLRQALKQAGALQKRLAQAAWAGGQQVPVSMGLAARNGRLISATRLLLEAAKSLEQAEKSGPGSIMAFQADPQKYRDSLAGTPRSQ